MQALADGLDFNDMSTEGATVSSNHADRAAFRAVTEDDSITGTSTVTPEVAPSFKSMSSKEGVAKPINCRPHTDLFTWCIQRM